MAQVLVLELSETARMSEMQKVMRAVMEGQDGAVLRGWVAIDEEADKVLTVFTGEED